MEYVRKNAYIGFISWRGVEVAISSCNKKRKTMRNITRTTVLAGFISLVFSHGALIYGSAGKDTFSIHYLGQSALYFEYKDLVIHVDCYSSYANYDTLPDADLILITHDHSDHYDVTALNKIKTDSTLMICTQTVKNKGTYSGVIQVMNNGDSLFLKGITIKAVPAYNTTSTFHAKGVGNGYVITLGEKRIYIAGDTELIPEMSGLGVIDIAFLPMNLPYTMTVAMAADAAKTIKPAILYIYHYGTSDTASLRNSLRDQNMVVRIGKSVYYESDKRAMVRMMRNEAAADKAGFNAIPHSPMRLFDLRGRRLQALNMPAEVFIINVHGKGSAVNRVRN
jgi:L-ascorbate metabolism protein UlaG (beta-lactamase superfamily)